MPEPFHEAKHHTMVSGRHFQVSWEEPFWEAVGMEVLCAFWELLLVLCAACIVMVTQWLHTVGQFRKHTDDLRDTLLVLRSDFWTCGFPGMSQRHVLPSTKMPRE